MAFLPTSIRRGALLNRSYPSKGNCQGMPQSLYRGAVGQGPLAKLPRRLPGVTLMVISGPVSVTPPHSPHLHCIGAFTGWNAQEGAELPHPIEIETLQSETVLESL